MEFLVEWYDDLNVSAPNSASQLGVRQRPLFLNSMQFLKLDIEALETILELLTTLLAQLHKRIRSIPKTTYRNILGACRACLGRACANCVSGLYDFNASQCSMLKDLVRDMHVAYIYS